MKGIRMRGEPDSARTEHGAGDFPRTCRDFGRDLPGRRVPQLDGALLPPQRYPSAIRRQAHGLGVQKVVFPLLARQFGAAGTVPNYYPSALGKIDVAIGQELDVL